MQVISDEEHDSMNTMTLTLESRRGETGEYTDAFGFETAEDGSLSVRFKDPDPDEGSDSQLVDEYGEDWRVVEASSVV